MEETTSPTFFKRSKSSGHNFGQGIWSVIIVKCWIDFVCPTVLDGTATSMTDSYAPRRFWLATFFLVRTE